MFKAVGIKTKCPSGRNVALHFNSFEILGLSNSKPAADGLSDGHSIFVGLHPIMLRIRPNEFLPLPVLPVGMKRDEGGLRYPVGVCKTIAQAFSLSK